MTTSLSIKRCSLFTVAIACVIFSLLSLWHMDAISVSTSNTVGIDSLHTDVARASLFDAKQAVSPTPSPYPSPSSSVTATPSSSFSPTPVIPSSSKTPSPSKSPSKSPSTSPTPYTVFINETLRGSRGSRRSVDHTVFTTVNTPIEIQLDKLFNSSETEFKVTSPRFGNFLIEEPIDSILNSSITYVPQNWFVGLDSFRCEGKEKSGRIISGVVHIRIRTGLILNRPLIVPPSNYTFAETSPSGTAEVAITLLHLERTLIPDNDTWLNRRYNRCAIVGNGGSLRGSQRGQEIDSHDIVMRLNLSPYLNYTEDVGSRMDISMSNGPASLNCWRRNVTMVPEGIQYEIVAQASFRIQWNKLEKCTEKNRNIKYLPMSYLFVDLVDNILNEYNRVMFNGTTKKYRSTGMMAVTAMAMICDHVSVYGFERGPNMENNYYDTKYDREWSGHSYPAEKAYYRDLAKGTGLFEKYLEGYTLFKSFAYIVN